MTNDKRDFHLLIVLLEKKRERLSGLRTSADDRADAASFCRTKQAIIPRASQCYSQ